MRVTKIGECRKKQNAIYVDDKYFGEIDHEVVLLSRMKEGSQVDEATLKKLVHESEMKKAREKAYRLLQSRSYTKIGFIEKLKREFSREIAKKTADKMEQVGLLNDEDFATQYAQELLYKKYFAKYRAIVELTKKGIDKSLAKKVVESIDIDERAQIHSLIGKIFRDVYTDEKAKRRAVMFLQRYGYGLDDILSELD